MNTDCIHYKIFLCAAGYEPEIRRITIDKDICHNYFYLKQKVLAIFPTLKDVAFTISWKDSEGDNIRICTDDELVIALKEMESNEFKKIYVNATPQGKEGPVHPDVICDGCENALHGFRYKCLVCLDYDLCPDCERSQMHPDHPMIRIPLPLSSEMPFGRRFARDIAKMGKHLERLLHHTADHMGDKKAKGDYSSSSRCGGSDNRKHKMKFCPRNDVQNFLHNLVYSQLEKMRGSASGDSNEAPNSPRPENTEPQASSSSDGNSNLEEQKKFVSILTSGLNSFLDPLGIDLIVEEDPVKEESPQKRPQSNLSENGSGANKTSLDGGASTSHTTSNFATAAAAPIVTQPGMTQTQPSLLINTDPVPPVAVVMPASQPLSNTTAPVSVASSSRTQPLASATVGIPPSAFTIGVPPPASMVGSQSSVTVGAQPSPSIGFQLPATIGVPPPMTIGVGTTPSVAIGVQPPPKVNVGAHVPVSSPEVPVMAATPVQTHVHPNPKLQPQVVSPAHSYQDEIPVLDSSWTIVNDGMGESILIQQPSSNEAAALPPQNTQESERIYPQLVTSSLMTTEEAMKIMEQLGFKNEEWLRQLIENKKGNIEEVLNFLSPISKPKLSTNLLP